MLPSRNQLFVKKARKVDRPIREGEHPELRPSIFCSPGSPNKRRECTGKCRQFNGFGLVQAGSGPGGRSCRTLVYKRTHTGDPDTNGVFGNQDCMGRVRRLPFEAVIGVGGISREPVALGIAGKINWIGIGARTRPCDVTACAALWSRSIILSYSRRMAASLRKLRQPSHGVCMRVALPGSCLTI